MQWIGGLALIAVILYDIFFAVVLPRRTGTFLRWSRYLIVAAWPIWRSIGMRLQPAWRREDFLGTFAPLTILLLLFSWTLGLVLGFGLTVHAVRGDFQPPILDFSTSVYVAGTSLLTIGFGDVVAISTGARFLMLAAGAAGLTIVALVITLMYTLYASFARREVLVLALDSRAGVPPSGVTLLETYAQFDILDELAETFTRFELWTAEMLDSHLAYPILPYFRSSHDGQSWVSALGAVLDAATLLAVAVDRDHPSAPAPKVRASAEMFYSIGCHAIIDLTQVRWFFAQFDPASEGPGIERAEFEAACQQLAESGLRVDYSEETWLVFAQRRAIYATRLNLLAQYLSTPPAPWVGDRSSLANLLAPHLGH